MEEQQCKQIHPNPAEGLLYAYKRAGKLDKFLGFIAKAIERDFGKEHTDQLVKFLRENLENRLEDAPNLGVSSGDRGCYAIELEAEDWESSESTGWYLPTANIHRRSWCGSSIMHAPLETAIRLIINPHLDGTGFLNGIIDNLSKCWCVLVERKLWASGRSDTSYTITFTAENIIY